MQIVVNHLTRMTAPRICVAGINPETGGHIRPTTASSDPVRSDTRAVVGVVGEGYEPLQNPSAFAFCDAITASGRAHWIGAGETRGGARVHALMRLDREIRIARWATSHRRTSPAAATASTFAALLLPGPRETVRRTQEDTLLSRAFVDGSDGTRTRDLRRDRPAF
jgi:hypothetical protein